MGMCRFRPKVRMKPLLCSADCFHALFLTCREKYSLEQDIREKEEAIRQKASEVQVWLLCLSSGLRNRIMSESCAGCMTVLGTALGL